MCVKVSQNFIECSIIRALHMKYVSRDKYVYTGCVTYGSCCVSISVQTRFDKLRFAAGKEMTIPSRNRSNLFFPPNSNRSTNTCYRIYIIYLEKMTEREREREIFYTYVERTIAFLSNNFSLCTIK